MRKWLIFIAALALAAVAHGQVSNQVFVPYPTAPASCSDQYFQGYFNTTTNIPYYCGPTPNTWTAWGGGGGSGTVSSGTTGEIAFYPSNGTTVNGASGVISDGSGNETANSYSATGAAPGAGGGGVIITGGSLPSTGTSGNGSIYADASGNVNIANGTAAPHPATQTICSGTIALGTSLIASGAAATTATGTCTGIASTDTVQVSFNGSPLAVTGYVPSANGMLTIISWPGTNLVDVSVINNTAASITPGAITLNFRVTR